MSAVHGQNPTKFLVASLRPYHSKNNNNEENIIQIIKVALGKTLGFVCWLVWSNSGAGSRRTYYYCCMYFAALYRAYCSLCFCAYSTYMLWLSELDVCFRAA